MTAKEKTNRTLNRCISRSGGVAELAVHLGVSAETVRSWARSGRVRQAPAAILMGMWFSERADTLARETLFNPDGLPPVGVE